MKFVDNDVGNFPATFFQPFHFSCKIGFQFRFLQQASKQQVRRMMSAIVMPKNFLSIPRQCSARSFSASQGRTCFLSSFAFTVSLELFC